MQVFELHFNPRNKEGTIGESFCYEPENVYEKGLGELCIVGQVANSACQNSLLLANLAQEMKSRYYSLHTPSPATALRAALKRGNEFLAETVKRGNVSWLGNLHLVVFTLKRSAARKETSFYFNFTKVGKIKIVLARDQGLVEIGKELELQEMDPYPFKIFFNIASGRLKPNDRVLVCPDPLFEKKQAVLERIATLPRMNDKSIKEVISKEELSEKDDLSGICFLANLTSQAQPLQQRLTWQKEAKSFFEKIKMPQFLEDKVWGFIKNKCWLIPSPLKMASNKVISLLKKIPMPRLPSSPRLPRSFAGTTMPKTFPRKKNLFLILFLVLCLLTGFFIFQTEKAKSLRVSREALARIEAKSQKAEGLVILKQEAKANVLFQEAWLELEDLTSASPQLKSEKALASQTSQLVDNFEKNLSLLNKLEAIKEPSVLFEYPQKIGLAQPSPKQALFGFSQEDLALYYLNSYSGQIIKYPYNLNSGWATPLPWLNSENDNNNAPNLVGAKAIAVDGSIWVLDRANQIHRFYQGLYQETIKLETFPLLQAPTKLWTSPQHGQLYLLDPGQNRLIILNKQGETVKQLQSEKFNHLLDFRVSPNEKTIWLLNGTKAYQIKI